MREKKWNREKEEEEVFNSFYLLIELRRAVQLGELKW